LSLQHDYILITFAALRHAHTHTRACSAHKHPHTLVCSLGAACSTW